MSNSIRIVLSICAVCVVAACAPPQQDVVYADTPMVASEPVFTGKYK